MNHPSGFQVEDFKGHVANHTMTVQIDDGHHRSLYFANGGSSNRYFRITTWEGSLCFSGDMGCFVFSRIDDMFRFFRPDANTPEGAIPVNPSYWSEKVEAVDKGDGMKQFYGQLVEPFLSDLVEEEAISQDLKEEFEEDWDGEEDSAYQFCCDHDLLDCEPDFSDFTYRYLWAIHAIVWAIQVYDARMEAFEEIPAPAESALRYGDRIHVKIAEAGVPASFSARICGISHRRFDPEVEYAVIDSDGVISDGYTASWISR